MTRPKTGLRLAYIDALTAVGGDRIALAILTRNPSVNDKRKQSPHLSELDSLNFLESFWEYDEKNAATMKRDAAVRARKAAYRIAPPDSLFHRTVTRTLAHADDSAAHGQAPGEQASG